MANIRISNKDKQEYNKLVKNVKSKIRNVKKKNGIDLTGEIPIPKLGDFTNRQAFNEWKTKASSFTNRYNLRYQFKTNKYGVTASVAELNEIERKNKLSQRLAKQKQKEYSKKPFMQGGKQYGTVGDRFGMMKKPKNVGFDIPGDFNFEVFQTRGELNRRKEIIERRANPKNFDRRLENFKDRYIVGIEERFNSDADDVVSKLKDMPADELYRLYLEYGEFQELFDPSPQAHYGIDLGAEDEDVRNLRAIESEVDRYFQDKDKQLLKDFPSQW